jgi:hypothetical protein
MSTELLTRLFIFHFGTPVRSLQSSCSGWHFYDIATAPLRWILASQYIISTFYQRNAWLIMAVNDAECTCDGTSKNDEKRLQLLSFVNNHESPAYPYTINHKQEL